MAHDKDTTCSLPDCPDRNDGEDDYNVVVNMDGSIGGRVELVDDDEAHPDDEPTPAQARREAIRSMEGGYAAPEDFAASCESGWTGDRCQLPLGHEGPHDNEAPAVVNPDGTPTPETVAALRGACQRATFDMHWCTAHDADFGDGEPTCEAVRRLCEGYLPESDGTVR